MALQTVMLVIQVLVALFLGVGDLRFPSPFLHDFHGSKDGTLIMFITVDAYGVLDQVWIVDISRDITITDKRFF